MARRATGCPQWAGDHFRVRMPRINGVRKWVDLPQAITTWEAARARAAELVADVRNRGATLVERGASGPAPKGETTSKWFDRFADEREAAGLTSVRDDRGRFAKHIEPVLGDVPIAAVTREQIEDVRDALDRKVRAQELAGKTAANVWALLCRMFAVACRSKLRTLRVRADNPCADVEPPDEGTERAKAYLYPNEFLAFVNHERAPLRWRRLVALAVYSVMRAGEIEVIDCEDFDLVHGTVHVHKAINRSNGQIKQTKGKEKRRFTMEPELVPLVRAMVTEAGETGRLLAMPPVEDLCEYLRKYLLQTGVARPEIFITDATRKNITFHDLRATGTTWMAIRGDDPLRIQHRAGHKDLSTTQRYIREAEAVRAGFGQVFPPLPAELLKPDPRRRVVAVPAGTQWSANGPGRKKKGPEAVLLPSPSVATPTGFEPVLLA